MKIISPSESAASKVVIHRGIKNDKFSHSLNMCQYVIVTFSYWIKRYHYRVWLSEGVCCVLMFCCDDTRMLYPCTAKNILSCIGIKMFIHLYNQEVPLHVMAVYSRQFDFLLRWWLGVKSWLWRIKDAGVKPDVSILLEIARVCR